MAGLISPLLIQSYPFGSETAWLDLLGVLGQWHYALAVATNTSYRLLDDLRDNLASHSAMHAEISEALGVTKVADLESFDLNESTSFISFLFLESADLTRFRTPAGL